MNMKSYLPVWAQEKDLDQAQVNSEYFPISACLGLSKQVLLESGLKKKAWKLDYDYD